MYMLCLPDSINSKIAEIHSEFLFELKEDLKSREILLKDVDDIIEKRKLIFIINFAVYVLNYCAEILLFYMITYFAILAMFSLGNLHVDWLKLFIVCDVLFLLVMLLNAFCVYVIVNRKWNDIKQYIKDFAISWMVGDIVPMDTVECFFDGDCSLNELIDDILIRNHLFDFMIDNELIEIDNWCNHTMTEKYVALLKKAKDKEVVVRDILMKWFISYRGNITLISLTGYAYGLKDIFTQDSVKDFVVSIICLAIACYRLSCEYDEDRYISDKLKISADKIVYLVGRDCCNGLDK